MAKKVVRRKAGGSVSATLSKKGASKEAAKAATKYRNALRQLAK